MRDPAQVGLPPTEFGKAFCREEDLPATAGQAGPPACGRRPSGDDLVHGQRTRVAGPVATQVEVISPCQALGKMVDRHGDVIVDTCSTSKGGTFLVLCSILHRQGQRSADRLYVPAGGGLRAQVLRDRHDGPLGGHFGRTKTGSLVLRLEFWVCQDVDVAEYIRTCQTCQPRPCRWPPGSHPPAAPPDAPRPYDRG